MVELLVDPDGYFDRDEFGFTVPALVLGGMAVCSLLVAGLRTTAVAQSIDGPGAQTALAIVGLTSMVAGLFTPLVTCLLYAVVIYALARFFGGSGSFRRTFWTVGYGFAPSLLGSVVLVGATAMAVPAVAPPESAEGITAFLARVDAHPTYDLARTINQASIVWCGFLWVFATKHVHDLDELDGVIAVGVPVVVTLALTVLGAS